jgi:hypothetical protein
MEYNILFFLVARSYRTKTGTVEKYKKKVMAIFNSPEKET